MPLVAGDDGWRIDVAALRDAVRDETTMIIINTPHNPTGTIFTRSELEAIADVALDSGAFVLADEVYERLLYDGHPHLSIADLDGMRDRCVIVSSAAMTFNVTGWKTGWVLGCPEVLSAVTTAKQFLSYVGVTHVQPAVARGLDECGEWVDAMAAELASNRDLLVSGLRELALEVHGADGGYFVVADVSSLGLGNAIETYRALPEKVGVAAIPVPAFVDYPEDPRWRDLVRFDFCKRREVREEGIGRMRDLLAPGNATSESGE